MTYYPCSMRRALPCVLWRQKDCEFPFFFPSLFLRPIFLPPCLSMFPRMFEGPLRVAAAAAAADKGLGQKERRFSFWEQRIGFVRNGRGEDGCCVNIVRKSRVIASLPPPLLIIPPFKWGTGRAGPSQSPQTFGSAKKEIFLLKNSNRFPRRRRCGEATAASPASSSVASWPPTRTVTGGASS